MPGVLLKVDRVIVDDVVCYVDYVAAETNRGMPRFTAQIVLPSTDVIILDDDSLATLELRVRNIAPALLYSRMIAGKATAA